ncbi:hypothetical protein AAAC51_21535 [Priestia megaterium]
MSQEMELLNKGIHLCKEIIDLLEKRGDRSAGFKQLVTKMISIPYLWNIRKIISGK